MNKLHLFIKLLLLAILTGNPAFSQEDEKSTIIGSPSITESAANIVADNVGNTYVGGVQGNKGLIVKQDAIHATIWSKTLAFTTNPNDDVTIGFLDLVGDTVFGCGKIHQANQLKGAFYFKMNAQTGTMYWSKYEMTSSGFFSCMRYANGKFFLVGGSHTAAQGTNGKVMAVSSQTGNLIWETPLLRYVFPLISTSMTNRTYFLNCTEVRNGKFYITGFSEGASIVQPNWIGMPLLIGITETGSVFMEKYLLLPYIINSGLNYVGAQIRWDMDDNLVIGSYGAGGMSVAYENTFIIKCDQGGNVLFAHSYNMANSSLSTVDAMNETADSYVLFGSASFSLVSYDGLYVLKTDKTGNPQTCKSIFKPNSWYMSMATSGNHMIGNSAFINNQHYFTMEEVGDINQFILDEDLESIQDCSEMEDVPVSGGPIQVSSPQLTVTTIPQTMTFQDGAILNDVPIADYCDNVSLDLVQNSTCDQSILSANIAGFTDPTFYWSNGTTSTSNTLTVSSTDTVFVRVLDIKCCELIDTIVPQIVPSAMTMTLPADTIVCLQAGSFFTLSPTVSNANTTAQYLWNNNSTGTSLTVTASGTYWVEVSDSCKTIRDSIVVEIRSLPTITNTHSVTVCEGDFPIDLNPVVSIGAAILWEDSTTSIPRSVSGPGIYTISATNSCGTVSANIVVSQTDLPEVTLTPLIDTCIQNGQSLVLSPTFTGTTSVLWSGGSTGNQLAVSASGTYTVFASNACGTDSAFCSVTINHFPELNLPAVLDTCFEVGVGFSYTAPGSAGSYQWSTGSQTATTWISQEGVYSCTLTNMCGSMTDSMQVRRYTTVDLVFPEDSIRDCQKQLSVSLLHVETNYDLEIFAPNGNLIGTYLTESGWYQLHAFNPCGEVWDSIYVNLQNEQSFYLPNSFTPNGDSYNDRYEFEGENVEVQSIRIFNRWGEEIFSQEGSFTGWDGRYKGEACPTGMYAVSVVYEDCFGIPTEFSGHVNLLR